MEGGLRGLVIVFSAFMVQFLAFGNYAIIGIYTVHLLPVFDHDAVGVSLVSAIHSALLLCSGPLASFLMTKISFRKLSLAGAALVSLGIFCTPLLVYLPTMYLFFGVFAGLGGCLIYLPSHVLSGLYYDKYRTISTGAATAGQGMGATVMPLIVGMLIEEYTWQGSLMILAGLDLHLFIFAIFMELPPKKIKKSTPTPIATDPLEHNHKQQHQEQQHQALQTQQPTSPAPQQQKQQPTQQSDSISFISRPTLSPKPSLNGDCAAFRYDRLNTSHVIEEEEEDDPGSCQLYSEKRRNSSSEHYEDLGRTPSVKRREIRGRRLRRTPSVAGSASLTSVPEDDISRIFIPSYLQWLPSFRNSFCLAEYDFMRETAIMDSTDQGLNEEHEEDTRSEGPNVDKVSLVSETSHVHISLKEHFKEHLNVITDFDFLIYFVSTIIWSMTTTMFVTFAPDLIVVKGHAAVDAAFVFTFYGVGQLVGCVFISLVGNFLGKRILLYMAANVLTGIFMSVVPLFFSFTEIAIVLVCLGFSLGGILGLYMIVSVDILGSRDMEIGLGYVLLASGMGCFAGPPLGGYLSQVFGRYDESFQMGGVLTVFAGLVMVLIYVPKCSNKKKSTSDDTNPGLALQHS